MHTHTHTSTNNQTNLSVKYRCLVSVLRSTFQPFRDQGLLWIIRMTEEFRTNPGRTLSHRWCLYRRCGRKNTAAIGKAIITCSSSAYSATTCLDSNDILQYI